MNIQCSHCRALHFEQEKRRSLLECLTTVVTKAKFKKEKAKDLLDIGNGTTIDKDENVILEHACIVDENLVEIMFKDIIEKKDYDAMSKIAILSPYNAETDNIKEKILDMLDGEEKIYLSIDESDPEKGPTVQPEVLNSIKIPGFLIHELRLKNGAIVICLRNLNTLKKICNGTRMQILDMKEHVLRYLIISQNAEEQEEVFIPRITLIEDKKNFFGLRHHQFPIRLAFSMTINKAQGQTYEEIGLNLKDEVFNHGQLYVACSRVRSWNKIHNDIIKTFIMNGFTLSYMTRDGGRK